MNKIVIYGAGGHGKVVADIIKKSKKFEIVGFVDDNTKLSGQKFFGYLILGAGQILPQLLKKNIKYCIVAIGDNNIRVNLAKKIKSIGFNLPTLIHPQATIASDVVFGEGTVVMAGAVINPGSKIGNYVIINTGATVDHDNIIEEGAHIAPGAHLGGGVKIGKKSLVAIGASVREYCEVGSNSIVGIGAAVIKSVPDNVVVVGVPAKILRTN